MRELAEMIRSGAPEAAGEDAVDPSEAAAAPSVGDVSERMASVMDRVGGSPRRRQNVAVTRRRRPPDH